MLTARVSEHEKGIGALYPWYFLYETDGEISRASNDVS